MSAIELILERNRSAARPAGPESWPKLCIVTCDDASLTARIEPLLGLSPGDAVVIRLPAGGGALSLDALQRAVAKAVYVGGCDEVLLVSHSGCTLYQLSTDKIVEALAREGVPRSAVPFDLRDLVGAGRDPRDAIRDAVNALRRCEYLPETLLVHLGHLDEATGRLELVEHGEQHKVPRSRSAGGAQVAGYQAGPTDLSKSVATAAPLPVIANMAPSVQLPTPSVASLTPSIQLSAPGVPEIRPFEMTPIDVTMPELTTGPLALDSVPAPQVTLTAEAFLGEAAITSPRPDVSASRPTLTAETFLGEAAATSPRPDVSVKLFADPAKAASPAPPRPLMTAEQAAKRVKEIRTSQKRRPSGQKTALKPELANAIAKVRVFFGNEIGGNERKQVIAEMQEALQNGATSEELVKIALRPVLQSGPNRYKVIDELILLKDEMVRMPPSQAASLIRQLVP
jgi:carbonic anhydrase